MTTAPMPTLHYDLGSPYAYLATERARSILGVEPHLEPILVGGIFVERGYGSWAHSPERETRIAEIEERASRYGLPPLRWPEDWPNNTLLAMRSAVAAEAAGRGRAFARAGFRHAFAMGCDLSDPVQVAEVATAAGLDSAALREAAESEETKRALRQATEDAWARGVRGVPSLEIDGEVFFGDDRLWVAAERLGANPGQVERVEAEEAP